MIGTQALLDYLRQDGALRDDREGYDGLMAAQYGKEAQLGSIGMEIKRRRQRQILQEVMRNAGMTDITRIAQPQNRQINYDSNEY